MRRRINASAARTTPTYEFSTGGASIGTGITIILPATAGSNDRVTLLYLTNASATEWQEIEPDAVVNGVAEAKIAGTGYFQIAAAQSNQTDAGVDAGTEEAGVIWYVDGDSSGGDGKSWDKALRTLKEALSNSQSGDQIWVAEGTYRPAESGGSRSSYFYLVPGVCVYGGFHGTEAAFTDRDDPVKPITVLSGDLNADDSWDYANISPTDRDDNTYHVVVGANNAVLDGFVVTAGNANGSTGEQQRGGGIYNLVCDGLKLVNVGIGGNQATGSGGGMYNAPNSYAKQELNHVVFAQNRAGSDGGGLYNPSGNATLNNVIFSDNTASGSGGGMYNQSGSPALTGVTFIGNNSSGGTNTGGGGLYSINGSPTLTNVIFNFNSANISGGGLFNVNGSTLLNNVTFASNTASSGSGGGIFNNGSNPKLTNVTFSINTASSGGGMHNQGVSPMLTNVIMWDDEVGSDNNEISGSGIIFSHSNIRGCGGSTSWKSSCGTDRGNNIDTATSPFAEYRFPSGSWTADLVFSSTTYETTLTNSSATWADGELVGMFIQSDVNNARRFLIAANNATTLIVPKLLVTAAPKGAMYYIHSIRLASDSQCRDSGDNDALPEDTQDLDGDGNTSETLPLDLDGNPRVVNDTVDMGAYEYQGG